MISVIVPIYFDRLELFPVIDQCLTSYIENSPEDSELIVVDDCSPMDTSDFPVTHRTEQNRGYTGAVNEGLRLANGEVIVVANDDIFFTKEFFSRVSAIRGDTGIFSPKTTDEGPGDKFGSIWCITRDAFDLLGPLDEKMKHYFSDADYYKRAKKMGIPITKWDDLVLEHVGGATYGNNGELYHQDGKEYRRKWGKID